MSMDLVPGSNAELESGQGFVLPPIIARAGQRAQESFLEFFFASIRNEHTRLAYARAVRDFFDWCEERGVDLDKIASSPLLVSGYIENHPGSVPTIKQHLAALRMLFDYLVKKGVVDNKPSHGCPRPKTNRARRKDSYPLPCPGAIAY